MPEREPDQILWQLAVYIEEGHEADLMELLSDLGYEVYRAWKVRANV
jgi:hypothetical protein